MQDLQDFLLPISFAELNEDEGYVDGQLGAHISTQHDDNFDIALADIVIVGVRENRGNGTVNKETDAADIIRKKLYRLYYWHTDITIADIGNVEVGATVTDSYAAIKTVLQELYKINKTVLIIGGSHDVTLAQYHAYFDTGKVIEATCIDAEINLKGESEVPAENFLLELFTGEPNILKHYNHIGFQSYFVHPLMLQTIDKLGFECYRLGRVQHEIEEMEPVLRSTHLLSFDVSAIKYSDAPANIKCPNGLTGVEGCMLTRFAGMSEHLSSFGMYGYHPKDDVNEVTASQIAQMLWYFIDGAHKKRQEFPLEERQHFNEYHLVFAEVDTLFLQSKRTDRWWMQMPNGKFIACSYKDYLTAAKNEFPERWLRAQERE